MSGSIKHKRTHLNKSLDLHRYIIDLFHRKLLDDAAKQNHLMVPSQQAA
jgi:hypothetical protein